MDFQHQDSNYSLLRRESGKVVAEGLTKQEMKNLLSERNRFFFTDDRPILEVQHPRYGVTEASRWLQEQKL